MTTRVDPTKVVEDLRDISIEYRSDSGVLRRRQLFMQVINIKPGGWALVLLVWQDYREYGKTKKRKYGWQPPRLGFERWRKVGHRWRRSNRISMDFDDARFSLGYALDLDLDALVAEADRTQDLRRSRIRKPSLPRSIHHIRSALQL